MQWSEADVADVVGEEEEEEMFHHQPKYDTSWVSDYKIYGPLSSRGSLASGPLYNFPVLPPRADDDQGRRDSYCLPSYPLTHTCKHNEA